jgi:hypothetical protein
MSNFKDVYDVSMRGFQSAIVEEQARFQQATLTGDLEEQVRASQSMAGSRSAMREYHALASEHAASLQRAMPQNPNGLSQTETEIARKSRPDLPADQAERLYAYNRHKLATMRANGSYSDGQGSVFKR